MRTFSKKIKVPMCEFTWNVQLKHTWWRAEVRTSQAALWRCWCLPALILVSGAPAGPSPALWSRPRRLVLVRAPGTRSSAPPASLCAAAAWWLAWCSLRFRPRCRISRRPSSLPPHPPRLPGQRPLPDASLEPGPAASAALAKHRHRGRSSNVNNEHTVNVH